MRNAPIFTCIISTSDIRVSQHRRDFDLDAEVAFLIVRGESWPASSKLSTPHTASSSGAKLCKQQIALPRRSFRRLRSRQCNARFLRTCFSADKRLIQGSSVAHTPQAQSHQPHLPSRLVWV